VNRYLLDTNVVSELRKPRPHGAVLAWLSELQESQIYLSAVTIGELQAGVERTRGQDSPKAAQIQSWIDQLEDSYQVLSMDSLCFREWARLMNGRPDDLLEDAMIAATARIHELVLATRNERDFAALGVRVFNPFKVMR
jgi:predicted nucleic acid-binding protein